VIAEYPKTLEKLFKVKEINKPGVYSLRFYIDGEIKNVIIDDRIPYDKRLKSTPFSKISKSQNIWPLLIEKAWAKHLGSYQNTISGNPKELFKILTGAPSYSLKTDDYPTEGERDALWHKLQNLYFQNYFICAATLSYDDKQTNNEISRLLMEIKSLGIPPNHAYSCLFFFEFNHSEKKLRLVKLRNPWGCMEHDKFEGEVITQKYMYIAEVKHNLGDPNKEGAFILTFNEFLKYFSTIYICQYHNYYNLITNKIYSEVCLTKNNNLNSSNQIPAHFKVFRVDLTNVSKESTMGIGDWAQSPIPNPQSPIPSITFCQFIEIVLNYYYTKLI
jgi:calpain-15